MYYKIKSWRGNIFLAKLVDNNLYLIRYVHVQINKNLFIQDENIGLLSKWTSDKDAEILSLTEDEKVEFL